MQKIVNVIKMILAWFSQRGSHIHIYMCVFILIYYSLFNKPFIIILNGNVKKNS